MVPGLRRIGPALAAVIGAGCGGDGATASVYGDAATLEVGSDAPMQEAGVDAPHDAGGDLAHEADAGSIKDVGAEEGAVPACTTSVECDDANPCTTDTCDQGSCEHVAISGKHLACHDHECGAVDNTATACTDKGGCTSAGDLCDVPAAGTCPSSQCPFDAQDRYLDGHFPHFGTPYNDEWYYYSGETITNPDFPKFTSHSCNNDSLHGVTRSSGHVRALHKGVIDVTFTGLSTAQANLIKDTLNSPKGWVRAGLKFNFGTSFSSATDIQFKYCASCSISVSGPQGNTTDPCGSGELAHHDSDYNVINFSAASCFNDLSSCSRWLVNHEVGHALGLADRENPATEGKTIMNHTHYYSIVWPSDALIDMVVALRACRGKSCIKP
ncbi:MAG: DUF3152 domain-containing protein [Deltaproteobacteria bacterium]|nr:DUF3152 domain-containing protein [Deltaproteobacteria bacterium]